MLRKRLNLKEKLGSIVKKEESQGVDNDCFDIPDVESGEELRLKSEANERGNTSSASSWLENEKEIFELQLGQLEDQLTASWLKNEELEEELKTLQGRDLVKQYKEEKKVNKSLRKRVSELERMLATMTRQAVDPEPLDSWETVERDESMEDEANQIDDQLQQTDDLIHSEDSEQQVMSSSQSDTEMAMGWRGRAMNWILDRMIDFTDEQPEPETMVMSDYPLTYKRLKKSLKRFGKHLKLSMRTASWAASVISWKNPFLTFAVFVVYMYAAWLDVLIPLLFLLCIGKLVVNYFYSTGLALQFGFQMDQPVEEEVTASKMQLILDVARNVQNKLAYAADNAEKIKNLFLWHEPKATKKLMMILIWAFLLTAFLPVRLVFKVVVMAAGVKIFIVRPIYIAFPRVERRYGSISRLYKGLPTDEQLKSYYELSEAERDIRRRRVVTSSPEHRRESAPSTLTPADYEFCQRFVIDPPEARIKPFDDGVACQLIDRSLSVFHMLKSGKLYLTASFLVFERLFRKNKGRLREDDYVLIALQDITSVEKCKPFGFLPGKGLAIEVTVTDQEKPYVFGAILSREQVYRTILETGAAAGLRWNNSSEDQ